MLSNKPDLSQQIEKKTKKKQVSNINTNDLNLINIVDIPFVVLKNDNSILFINEAAKGLFKLNKYSNIFHNFRRPEFRENILKFRKTKKKTDHFTLELFNVPLTMFFDVKIFKLSNNNILLSFMDITRIQKLENVRSDFIGNVSHELKTPLATIMNIVELLNEVKKTDVSEQKQLHKILKMESGKMKLIIEDLLQLTKIETQSNQQIFKTLNLNEIVKNSISGISTIAKLKNINIKYEGQKNLNIKGNKNQLHQMFVNILDNSVKYSKNHSKIFVFLKNIKDKYILTFKDNGKGIPHALIPRITERFYRVPDNKLENIEGTGLGLAIVKHIALAHDAKLNISSRIGVGTKIEILFEKKLSSTRLDL